MNCMATVKNPNSRATRVLCKKAITNAAHETPGSISMGGPFLE